MYPKLKALSALWKYPETKYIYNKCGRLKAQDGPYKIQKIHSEGHLLFLQNTISGVVKHFVFLLQIH